MFADRHDAGRQLARRLSHYRGQDTIVLALPRGGVPVAAEIADELDARLDVLVARKLGAPGRPELGVGAIAEGGEPILDERTLSLVGVTAEDMDATIEAERAELARRVRDYRGDRPLPDVSGRTVILVDDGLATGVTARAGLEALRRHDPGRLVLAVPVAAPATAQSMEERADDVVVLHTPEAFAAVGQWYTDFRQTSDETVQELLEKARARQGTQG